MQKASRFSGSLFLNNFALFSKRYNGERGMHLVDHSREVPPLSAVERSWAAAAYWRLVLPERGVV
ncbi:hypothetical protein Bbad01_11830 [Bacillus badius]|nr:hypothetical protein Bbad01_11830 [Bacillus badius]